MATAKAEAVHTFKTHVDLPEEVRHDLVHLLNARLADTSDLRSQVKQAHWNVKGKDFYQLHLLFDEIAAELSEFVDQIAERATSLGGYALGTVRMAAEASVIPEYPTSAIEGREHLEALVERVGHFANLVRKAIDESDELGDKSTADLFTEISRVADKRLWFLEAHLQGNR